MSVKTRSQNGVIRRDMARDDLLVSWKDIAAYLKCSVRKAQRLETRELPVNRISGTKSVWASKTDIDRWLSLQAENTKAQLAPRLAIIQRAMPPSAARWLIGIALILAALTLRAATASQYGLAIASFGVTSLVLMSAYSSLSDSAYARAFIGLFVVLGMAYGTSATTLPDLVGSVVNMSTIRPALFYPLAAGFRFIPIPILIAVTHIARLRHPRVYFCLGLGCLVLAASTGLMNSGALRIWQAVLPIRWTILAGESFVIAVNIALFVAGYRLLQAKESRGFQSLLPWYATGYLLIALTAAIIGRHWNEIDKYHLDVRYPDAYQVQETKARDVFHAWLSEHASEAGADLVALFDDSEFLMALQTRNFYKQEFDEFFQGEGKAVILGYRLEAESPRRAAPFLRIRFPVSLAAALRFDLHNARR
jgi:hypothetical protein